MSTYCANSGGGSHSGNTKVAVTLGSADPFYSSYPSDTADSPNSVSVSYLCCLNCLGCCCLPRQSCQPNWLCLLSIHYPPTQLISLSKLSHSTQLPMMSLLKWLSQLNHMQLCRCNHCRQHRQCCYCSLDIWIYSAANALKSSYHDIQCRKHSEILIPCQVHCLVREGKCVSSPRCCT